MATPQVAVNDILETVLVWSAGSFSAVCKIHWEVVQVGVNIPEMADIAKQIADGAQPLDAPLHPVSVTFDGVGCARVDPGARTLSFGGGNLPTPGTATGDVMARAVAGIITKHTNFAGQRFRGRSFIPYPGEVHNINPGVPSSNYTGDLQALADFLFSPLNIAQSGRTGLIAPVLWHRQSHTFTAVSGAKARTYWGTQKRRNRHNYPAI